MLGCFHSDVAGDKDFFQLFQYMALSKQPAVLIVADREAEKAAVAGTSVCPPRQSESSIAEFNPGRLLTVTCAESQSSKKRG
jgi:hypothetical protein